MNTLHRRALATLSAISAAALMISAGPLNPPAGAVTGTAKPLSEVEPRIAINSTNTPGDLNYTFRITQPGSYYFTGNLSGTAFHSGILIAASDVTIDLNGFTFNGATGTQSAFTTDSARNNIRIRNGTISNWPFSAVALTTGGGGAASVIEDIRSTSCAGQNIVVGPNSQIRRCTVENAGSYGIYIIGGKCLIESCTVRTAVSFGIIANDGTVVRDCSVSGVGGVGISASSAVIVEACTAYSNATGIYVELGSQVSGCVARANTGPGIYANIGCLVLNNNVMGNGAGATDGAGIDVYGADSRIEGNNMVQNDRGLKVESSGNIILRNSASGNSIVNWDIVAGNAVAPIVSTGTNGAAISGNTFAGSLGSTDPSANFTF